jgi:hypothetical protein
MILIYTLAWFPLVLLAILNGALREKGYRRFMSELRAHQLSTLIGIVLVGIYVWIMELLWPLESSQQAFQIGGIWLVLTILFEFGFGHYVMGHPWERLFHDYNILTGRVWLVFVIWTAISPLVIFILTT